MRTLCWNRNGDVRVDTVPDPKNQHPRDAVIKITACVPTHPADFEKCRDKDDGVIKVTLRPGR